MSTAFCGRYLAVREIARGTRNRILRGWDPCLKRTVVLKTPHPEAGPEEGRERIHREARLLSRVRHPGVVRIHNVHLKEEPCLVLDYVRGEPLRAVLRRVARRESPGLEVDELCSGSPHAGRSLLKAGSWDHSAAQVFREIVRGMECVHGNELLHRNLNPDHILLSAGGAPTIVDFGLAVGQNEPTPPGESPLESNHAYVAPEQIEEGRLGSRVSVDIYQLGLCLYEMLTLRPAILPASWGTMAQRIHSGKVTRPRLLRRAIPHELEFICLKALRRDPRQRYTSAVDLGRDLDRFLGRRKLRPSPSWSRSFLARLPGARWSRLREAFLS